jgi:hypothetical protein
MFQKESINKEENPENKQTVHTFKQAIFSNNLILKLSPEIAGKPYPVGNGDSLGILPLLSRSAIQEYIGVSAALSGVRPRGSICFTAHSFVFHQ